MVVETSDILVFEEVQRLGGCQASGVSPSCGLENITVQELEEIRRLKNPPVVVRRTLEMVCLILSAGNAPSSSAPPQWPKVQRMLERNFVHRMLSFDLELLRTAPKLSRYLVAEYFFSSDGAHAKKDRDSLTFSRVRRASRPVSALFRWCCKHLELVGEEHEELTVPERMEEDDPLDSGSGEEHQEQTEPERFEEDGPLHTGSGQEQPEPEGVDQDLESAHEAQQQVEKEGFEVFTDDGWEDMGVLVTRMIVTAAQDNRCTFEYSARGFRYKVDLNRMMQINKDTFRARPIRRWVAKVK